MSHTLNLISYTSGFLGTVMFFKFGVPSLIDTDGKRSLLAEQEDEDEKKKIAKYKRLGRCGLGLIAFGFLLQMLGELSYFGLNISLLNMF